MTTPAGGSLLGELDRQQVEHRILAGGIDVAALAGSDALEPQRRAAAPQLGARAHSAASQSKRSSADHQPLFLRAPDDVGDLDQGILQMGGDDLEVVRVEGNEFQRLHDALPAVRVCNAIG